MTMNITKTSRNVFLCAALGALGLVGCADTSAEGDVEPASDSVEQAPETAALQADPNKINIASVSASGSGCPAGSWSKSISPDGLALTMTFSRYFLETGPTSTAVKSLACNVSLRLNMPSGYSVGVTKISYSGYAYLERGVNAEQIVNYAWTGAGTISQNEAKSTITGPYDNNYVFTDNVQTSGRGIVWSPCNITSNLQVRTRLVLNNTSRATGYVNTNALDVQQDTKLVISFGQKSC